MRNIIKVFIGMLSVIIISSCSQNDNPRPREYLKIELDNSEWNSQEIGSLGENEIRAICDSNLYVVFKTHFNTDGVLFGDIWTHTSALERANASITLTNNPKYISADNMEYVISSKDEPGRGFPSTYIEDGFSITVIKHGNGDREVWSSAFGSQPNSSLSFTEVEAYKIPNFETIRVWGKVRFDCLLYNCCDGRVKHLSGDGHITFMRWYSYD